MIKFIFTGVISYLAIRVNGRLKGCLERPFTSSAGALGAGSMSIATLSILVALCSLPRAQCEYARLVSADSVVEGDFGRALALDGAWMAVGQERADHSAPLLGAVYVYERLGSNWFFRQKLVAPGTNVCAFGTSVALEGEVLVVGSGSGCWSDEAWVFERSGGVWSLAATLSSPNPSELDFGRAIAVGGGIVAVGDPGRQEVYLFENAISGWQQASMIQAPATGNVSFGATLAFAGGSLAVGDWQFAAPHPGSGAVHIFEEVAGDWSELQLLQDAAPEAVDYFGWALRADGDLLAAISNRPLQAVTIFERAAGVWTESAVVTASSPPPLYGLSGPEALAVDGDTVLLGETYFDGFRGRVRILRDTGSGWGDVGSLQPMDLGLQDHTGSATALDGDHVVVAALGFDEALDDVGSVTGHTISGALCYTLEGYPKTLSTSTGATATLLLDAPGHGDAFFGMAGTLSGTSPGLPLGAFQVPLNPDAYFQLSLRAPSSIFHNMVGVLDFQGRATARIDMPAGVALSFVGLRLHHAYLVVSGTGVVHVSNSWPHRLVF